MIITVKICISINQVDIPTDKKGLIAFLNIYFPEGGG